MTRSLVFNGTVGANTRTVFFSEKIEKDVMIKSIAVSFALNTQRTFRIRLYQCDGPGTNPVRNGQKASGVSLLGLEGDDYVVGDGQEGEIKRMINRRLMPLSCLAVDGENLDSYEHTVDVTVEVEDA